MNLNRVETPDGSAWQMTDAPETYLTIEELQEEIAALNNALAAQRDRNDALRDGLHDCQSFMKTMETEHARWWETIKMSRKQFALERDHHRKDYASLLAQFHNTNDPGAMFQEMAKHATHMAFLNTQCLNRWNSMLLAFKKVGDDANHAVMSKLPIN